MKRFVVGVLCGALGAAVGWACGVSEYRAAALIEIMPSRMALAYAVGGDGSTGQVLLRDAFFEKYVSMFGSPRVASRAWRDPEWRRLRESAALMDADSFADRVEIRRVPPASLIEVAFVHPDGGVATAAARSLTAACLDLATERDAATSPIADTERRRIKLIAQLHDLREQERVRTNGLGARFLESSYDRRADEIGVLRARVDEVDIEIAEAGQADVAGLTRRRAALLELRAEREADFESIAKMWASVKEVMRQQEMISARLQTLNDETAIAQLATARLVVKPATPTEPTTDNRLETAVFGALIGLTLGVGVTAQMRR